MVESALKITSSNLSFKGPVASARENFLEVLKQTYAKETGKLVGTKLPGESGVIFSPNPQNLLSFNRSPIV